MGKIKYNNSVRTERIDGGTLSNKGNHA